MVASQRKMVATILSSTMENRGTETMALAEAFVKQGWGFCARVVPGSEALTMMAGSREETNSTIISSTLENKGLETMALNRVANKRWQGFLLAGAGSGSLGGALVVMVLSKEKIVDPIISSSLKNRGEEMTVQVGLAIKREQGDVYRNGPGTLNPASVTMALLWGKMVGVIFSSILKNGGEEMRVSMGAVIEQG